MRFRRKRNEEEETAATAEPPTPEPPAAESPLSVGADSNGSDAHPEVLVGAAFVGGLALAQIMKRFGR